jgi:hypothetical protein
LPGATLSAPKATGGLRVSLAAIGAGAGAAGFGGSVFAGSAFAGSALGVSATLATSAFGASAVAAGAAAAASSISATTLPSDTPSPTLTLSSRTTPAKGAGTSMVALSDSRVTSPWSAFTVSPTATSSSITGMSR